ncbi:MAG: hypothetical protein ABEJ72_01590, partial [Candidatus Aenigmatarchaeota archaeon]
MSYVYRLAGDNLELAESELEGFLEAVKVDERPERKGRICFTKNHPGQLKRLALTHEVAEVIERG